VRHVKRSRILSLCAGDPRCFDPGPTTSPAATPWCARTTMRLYATHSPAKPPSVLEVT